MKLLSGLQSLRTNLLDLEVAFHKSGQISTFRLTIGLPVVIFMGMVEILRLWFH